MDFSDLKPKTKEKLSVDPIEIFQTHKISDQNINDLWLAQGDALREWHDNREKNDIGIVLNTGAGKTLVGLLAAQSLVNETQGCILYACSSIQLVEQTAEKAAGYGINVTTYFRGNFSDDLFHQGKAPCITTYQALFNGKSKFFAHDVSAVIFDDAHAAEHLLRDHFSLTIEKNEYEGVYQEIFRLFHDYHRSVGKIASYEEILEDDGNQLIFIPPFEIQKSFHELMRILTNAGFPATVSTTFTWEHLKDHIDLCAILISTRAITITPPFVPVRHLPYFHQGIRRIYLSATLSAKDAFTRTFGKQPDLVIAPSTTAGECERMLVVPSLISEKDIDIAKVLIADRKALILVPTYRRANQWTDIATLPDGNQTTEAVREFKATTDNQKLLLAARYDGVDLPGDTCRLIVIDDLPMGVGPLERYMWEHLSLSNTLRSAIASRVVQSFGRISRGMSDHGVVIITGSKLVQWLTIPKNRAVLPKFLQKQILLGRHLSERASNVSDLESAIDQCISRDDGWLEAYDGYIKNCEVEESTEDLDTLTSVAESEANYAIAIWERDYPSAIEVLTSTLDSAFELSASTGAWHKIWLGRAIELAGDHAAANNLYRQAHGAQRNLPRIATDGQELEIEAVSEQVINLEQQFTISPQSTLITPKNFQLSLIHLDGSGSPKQVEESLRALGEFLGLNSSRPDNEVGTGPDVLWHLEGGVALCIEAKTDKMENSSYRKEDVGQLLDHIQWVKDNKQISSIVPVFVGPLLSPSDTVNPSEGILVIELGEFFKVANKLTAILHDIAKSALPITLRTTTNDLLIERELNWPDLMNNITTRRLKDL